MKLKHLATSFLLASTLVSVSTSQAQMVTSNDMPGYGDVFGLAKAQQSSDYSVAQTASSLDTNILWPGDRISLSFHLINKTDQPIQMTGRVDVIGYGTRIKPGDIWVPNVFKIGQALSVPVEVNLPAKGTADVTIAPPIPARFGGYGLVFDLGTHGRAFGATVTRTVAADAGKQRLPVFALDMPWPFEMSETVTNTFKRLGTKACRMGASYTPTTSPDFEHDLAELTKFLKWSQDNDISVMLTIGAGSAPQPLGRGRPWLNDDNSMKENVKEDLAWLPEYDADFQKWVKIVCSRFGWPKGPVNAVELWNEPWEGVSISGWGADLPRYREIYEHMANGVMDARRDAGVKVLIGGASSSSNTIDKLFPDGKDTFLPMLDFVSIHYQEMSATPSLMPEWMHRTGPYGRVQVWDTESWVGNAEDRIAGVRASMRAQGQDRAVGIYGGNVYQSQKSTIDGKDYAICQVWSPAAAVAATEKFLGQRPFKRLLFSNGLPWVFDFAPGAGSAHPDDGTLVVLGDLGGIYNRNRTLFRETQAALAKNARLTFPNNPHFRLLDFYGNPVVSKSNTISVPLNGLGYYLRTDGSPGSFARLERAVSTARIVGYPPVHVAISDMTAPLGRRPVLKINLTNVLNHPVVGVLNVSVANRPLSPIPLRLGLAANQTKELDLLVVGVTPTPNNTYALSLTFNAGPDGMTKHQENVHANVIARRAIVVDGKLDDWKGVLPQPLSGEGIKANLTETAWLPFKNYDAGIGKGLATGYLAYDKNFFYFAAKIADNTPYPGNVRFAKRDDNAYYYPETVTDKGQAKTWPAGVRRFSYRRDPDLPSGNGTDNVQIAFNVVDEEHKPWASHPPGTMPRWMAYPDSDYEYALNQVAPAYGGGTEIWRMLVPGMPRKHFYPRQPKSRFDGPVTSGKLTIRRDGNTRLVEAALPWSEIPLVKKRLDAGLPIKFSFRVNDNGGTALELAQDRSVSKENGLAFHNDWVTHWGNEVEFGWDK